MKVPSILFLVLFALSSMRGWGAEQDPSWLVPPGKRQAVVKEVGDGEGRRVVLENGFLRAVVNPQAGARIESLIHKRSGQDLTMPLSETRPGGLLSDHVWQQDYWRGDWLRATCGVKVLEQGPARVRVSFSAFGKMWKGLGIKKTVSLGNESSQLHVDYALTANDEVAKNCRPDFNFHQAFSRPGKIYLPSESGVLAKPFSTESESWVFDPAGGWVGYIGDRGVGLGARMEFARLRAMRAASEPSTVVEWILRKMELRPGSAIQTPVSLAPFDGLTEVSAIGERAAVGIELAAFAEGTPREAKVSIAPFQDFTGKISLALRPLVGGGVPVPVDERELKLSADQPTRYAVPLKKMGADNLVLEAVFRSEGMKDLCFTKPVFIPGGKGVYVVAPEAKRIPETPDTPTWQRYHPIDFNFNSTAVPTPHRVWARPYAGGRPRVLVLVPEGSERDAVELAQRFDIELTCALLLENTYYALGDAVRSLRNASVQASLEKTLEGNYDVILLNAANSWPRLTPKAKQRVVEMVKAGTGLVLNQRGDAPPELKDFMPFEFAGYDRASGRFTTVKDAPPILKALPFEAMPISLACNGSKLRAGPDGAPMGQALLRVVLDGVDRGPLVAVGHMGKGRVVENCADGNVIPGLWKFIHAHARNDPMPAFDYWEYHYAMLARLIYWAAGKDSGVTLLEVVAGDAEVTVGLSSTRTGKAVVRMTLRDYFGEKLAEKAQGIELSGKGGQSIAFPLDPRMPIRPLLADIEVSGAEGVMAFGAGVFPPSDARFTRVSPEKPVYDRAESATVIASITNAIPTGAVVRAEVRDGSNRLISTTEATAVAETHLHLPLRRAIGPYYQVRTALVAGGRTIDQGHFESKLKAIREPQRYRAFFWGGLGGAYPQNIIESYYRYLKSFGINANFSSEGPSFYDNPVLRRLNMPYSTVATGMASNTGVTKEQAAAGPIEAGNVVGSPDAYEEKRLAGEKAGAARKDEDILLYSCGDENRGPIKDIDFSEQGKRAFRKWLQEKAYKNIDELNAEWKTSYKSFEEVIAMTEAEARAYGARTGTYAPWLDQRRWLEWGNAALARSITDGVLKHDPAARVGESGSQEPAVYLSGRDWWLMSRSYTGLAAYSGIQTTEQESYAPDMVRYSWAGYGKPNPFTRAPIYNILGNFDRGIAIFAARSHIDPDFTMPECGRDLRGVLVELSRGIGQALVSAKSVKDPVFVLQSPSSMYGAYIHGLDTFAKDSRISVTRVLRSLGIRFQSLSYEQLGRGDLATCGARVLVLPATVALAPGQIAMIRNWVREGGTLVADVRTALMTEHGRLYPSPELDDVFGVDRSKAILVASSKEDPFVAAADGVPDEEGCPVRLVESGLQATAHPLWKVRHQAETFPAVFENAFGKGRAFYFSTDLFTSYPDLADHAQDPVTLRRFQKYLGLFDQILSQARVTPHLVVENLDPTSGKPTGRSPWIWSWVKASGNIRFAMIQRDYSSASVAMEDVPARVKFREPGVIYDVFAGKMLGRGDSVDLTLLNSTSRLLALHPSEVRGVNVKPPSAHVLAGSDASVACEVVVAKGKPGPRVLNVEVIDPSGRKNDPYSTQLITADGHGTLVLPFVANDTRGTWTLWITDVASGVQGRARLELR